MPLFQRAKTVHASDRAATVIGMDYNSTTQVLDTAALQKVTLAAAQELSLHLKNKLNFVILD
jgi:hypothetical protein